MILKRGPTVEYLVDQLVAEGPAQRLYACRDQEGKELLLQVASEAENNGKLERVAFLLNDLMETAGRYEEAYTQKFPGKRLGYVNLLPRVVDSFVFDDQGKRRINILALYKADCLNKVIPLSNITDLDRRRVDLASSAWVLGRLLKLLAFVHGEGVVNRGIAGGNILIQPDHHTMAVLDWTNALMYQAQEEVSKEESRADIVGAARAVFVAIGGDPDSGSYPYDTENAEQYVQYLARLCMGHEASAENAHHKFYDLVDEHFGHSFREFQTFAL